MAPPVKKKHRKKTKIAVLMQTNKITINEIADGTGIVRQVISAMKNMTRKKFNASTYNSVAHFLTQKLGREVTANDVTGYEDGKEEKGNG